MLAVSLDFPFLLHLRYSLTFICSLSDVPYVAMLSGLSFFFAPSVISNIYLSCVLCTLYCQFLWIVFFFAPSVFTKKYLSCVLCTLLPLYCQFLWIVLFFAPSVFSNIYSSCVLCTLCCQFLWIVLLHCPFGIL